MGSQPTILVARLDDTRTLYAVERESRGLYVLCQLGSWVNLHELRAVAVVSRQDLPERAGPQVPTTLPLPISESNKYSKKKRLAIEAIQSMVKRPSTSHLTDTQPESQRSTLDLEPPFTDYPAPSQDAPHQELTNQKLKVVPPIDDVISQPTAAEIFENVRTQYLEALYLSKASYGLILLIYYIDLFRHL